MNFIHIVINLQHYNSSLFFNCIYASLSLAKNTFATMILSTFLW